MKIAVAGLGKMGMQIAQKLLEDQHQVVAYDINSETVDSAQNLGAEPAYDKRQLIDAFNDQQVVLWVMIPSDIVDNEIDSWLEIMPHGSIIIDGGNSDFRGDKLRSVRASEKGVSLLDIGTSGGIWGYKNGFSMMVGGEEQSYKTVEPVLSTLAKPSGAYARFGSSGAGHYVKMVHNAIEYGMMESLAEGYRMLKEGPYDALDLALAGDIWQHGSVVTSWLNELTRDALRDNPTLEGIEGFVAESGEARWTLEIADQLGISLPAIQTSFDVRLNSQKGEVNFATKLLAAMRNKFGGHSIEKPKS